MDRILKFWQNSKSRRKIDIFQFLWTFVVVFSKFQICDKISLEGWFCIAKCARSSLKIARKTISFNKNRKQRSLINLYKLNYAKSIWKCPLEEIGRFSVKIIEWSKNFDKLWEFLDNFFRQFFLVSWKLNINNYMKK